MAYRRRLPFSVSNNNNAAAVEPMSSTPRDLVRQRRLNSWAFGTHSSLFNPQCPIHGHRALIEAYTREKLLQVKLKI
jgi:hypothetical protein